MASKGHITKTKLVTILANFKARIEEALKDMRHFIGSIDLLVGLGQSLFADLPDGDFTDSAPQPHLTLNLHLDPELRPERH